MNAIFKPLIVCLLLASVGATACWADDDADSDDDDSTTTSTSVSSSNTSDSGSASGGQDTQLTARQAQSCNTNLCLGEGGAQFAECANPLKTLYDMKPHKRPSYLAACPK